MPRIGARTASVNRTRLRPAGLARGVNAYVAAWLGSAMIAVLTGATGVVVLLTVGLVVALAGALAGLAALRGVQVHDVYTATVATAGDDLPWNIRTTLRGRSRRPVHAILLVDGVKVAGGWLHDGVTTIGGHAPRRAVHREVDVQVCSAGRLGMLWWRRTQQFAIAPLHCGPAPAATPAPAERAGDDADGMAMSGARLGRDDVDGVRQWRDGDEVTAVHWPSTVRLGEFVVREHRRDQQERWVVTARTGTGAPDAEAARVRRALDDCLSRGAAPAVRVDDSEPDDIVDQAAAVRWCAAFEPTVDADTRVPWWRRELHRRDPEPDTTLRPAARWAVALASAVPLAMLLQPLGYGVGDWLLVVAAVAVGAFVTTRRRPVRQWLRQLAGLVTGLAVLVALVDIGAVVGVMSAMRYLMPQLLVALCVVQGFECTDRRGARVSLACSALLASYAAGVRVDGALGAYMLASVVLLAVGAQAVVRSDGRVVADGDASTGRRDTRGAVVRVGGAVMAVAAVVAILAVLPVPKGPAQLNLPAWLSERRPVELSNELARPDGSPLLGGAVQGNGSRSGSGPGGYPGFSTMMDTSMRGELGNEVVLRVRAAAPDFWRGQTFSRFDGTTWYIERFPNTSGTEGPVHEIPPGVGDVVFFDEAEYTQTFYVAVDMPNILFAAPQAQRVLLDATVWHRPDGALRSDVVLPAGSAYTVQSHRQPVTATALRDQGFGWQTPTPSALQLPDSTTDRTRALAAQLAAGSASTYDTIERIQRWLRDNVQYDLDAPVPEAGHDAVDDFLFESKRGFCEQIASATAVMLRSLGVPTRLATGYVPSERDELAGVWISRASDAHAWVEVWFPNYGWVPFDPTAQVPLAGESSVDSIGVQLVRALMAMVGDHIGQLLAIGAGLAVLTVLVRGARSAWRRHRRGRWGVLQDRFVAAAVARGAAPTAPNAEMADVFHDDRASTVARVLDECAFSPSWHEDDARFREVGGALDVLERAR